ncbi:MAG: HAMP domain-containing histidine kinase [Gracilibacteraceae bacterium]|nr:HAMP domain-containing histidine kinase [Gracilibacteraceae bacterium]
MGQKTISNLEAMTPLYLIEFPSGGYMDPDCTAGEPVTAAKTAPFLEQAASAHMSEELILTNYYKLLDFNNDLDVFFYDQNFNLVISNIVLAKSDFIVEKKLVPRHLLIEPDQVSQLKEFKNGNSSFLQYVLSVSCECLPSVRYISLIKCIDQHYMLMKYITGVLTASSALGLIALLTASFLITKKITAPLKELEVYAQSVRHPIEDAFTPNAQITEINSLGVNIQSMVQKLQKNEKDQQLYFADFSHSLKTPLMVIQGYAEALRDDVFEDKTQIAAVIMNESQKMTNLVNQLLTMTKLEQPADLHSSETVNIREVVEECLEMISGVLADTSLLIDLQIDSAHYAWANPQLLRMAISNLLTNSLKFTRSCITLSSRAVGDKMHITVTDDGAGIADEELPLIFTTFYKGSGIGAGLGLSIVKLAVKNMNGSVSVYNQDGHTFFDIRLPLPDPIHSGN